MSGKGLNGKKIIKIAMAAVLVLAVVFAALYVKSLLDNAPDLVPYNGSNTNNAADVPEPSPGSNRTTVCVPSVASFFSLSAMM